METKAIVSISGNLYIDETDGKLYSDVTLETPFTATVGEDTVQVEMLAENTVTIGGADYTKLTAGEYEVETSEEHKIVVNSENVICELVDGVPEGTNYSIVVPDPPSEEEQESEST